jgi:HSP20 family protein
VDTARDDSTVGRLGAEAARTANRLPAARGSGAKIPRNRGGRAVERALLSPPSSRLGRERQEENMANISVRKNGSETAPSSIVEWDPFRVMREFLRWDPFREMAPVLPADERLSFAPAFEVKETNDGYLFKADVPGVKQQDLEITMTGNRMTVSGKRETERHDKSDTFYAYERSYGTFTRSFTLPEGADAEKVQADLKDGVLTIALPKKPELQPKKIAIAASDPKKEPAKA